MLWEKQKINFHVESWLLLEMCPLHLRLRDVCFGAELRLTVIFSKDDNITCFSSVSEIYSQSGKILCISGHKARLWGRGSVPSAKGSLYSSSVRGLQRSCPLGELLPERASQCIYHSVVVIWVHVFEIVCPCKNLILNINVVSSIMFFLHYSI